MLYVLQFGVLYVGQQQRLLQIEFRFNLKFRIELRIEFGR